jgi:hypothetical protein
VSNIFQQSPFSYQYVVGLENAIHELSNTVNQGGVVVDAPLHSVLVPINTAVLNGQRIFVEGIGSHIGAGGNKTLTIRINLVNHMVVTFPASASALAWHAWFSLRRFSATTLTAMMHVFHNFPVTGTAPGATTVVSLSKGVSPVPLETGSFLIEFLASVPNGGDSVTQTLSLATVI